MKILTLTLLSNESLSYFSTRIYILNIQQDLFYKFITIARKK